MLALAGLLEKLRLSTLALPLPRIHVRKRNTRMHDRQHLERESVCTPDMAKAVQEAKEAGDRGREGLLKRVAGQSFSIPHAAV